MQNDRFFILLSWLGLCLIEDSSFVCFPCQAGLEEVISKEGQEKGKTALTQKGRQRKTGQRALFSLMLGIRWLGQALEVPT